MRLCVNHISICGTHGAPDTMRHCYHKRLILPVGLSLLAGLLVGCGEPTIDEEEAADFVDEWSQSVGAHLEAEAAEAAGSQALEERLDELADADRDQLRSDEPFYSVLAWDVYDERDFEPAMVDEGGITATGEAVIETLLAVDDHNLDVEPYRLEDITQARDALEQRRENVDGFDGLEATDGDRQQAVSWLVEQPESDFELNSDNHDALTEALLEADEYGQRLRDNIEEYRDKRSAIAEAAAELEAISATGLARYAGEQRHRHIKEIFVHPRHWDYYNEPDVDDSGRRPDPDRGGFLAGQVWREASHIAEDIAEENEHDIIDDKIREAVAEVLDSDEPRQRLDAIPPQQPQYAGLVDEYRRYRDIVEDGGWPEVERADQLRPGHSSDVVADLKERLRIEGYFPEDVDIDETFDDDLEEAIREYQETHQMHVDGRPNHVFWYSLNISAERRFDQIGLNLDRWRETNVDHSDPTYTFVNIPDFTVEVWNEQERQLRFATIVGDNDKDINPLTDEAEYANRTPTPMSAYIDRVIFNPYWNVTDRIRAQRILPDVQESIERKYALKFDHYLDEARQGAEELSTDDVTLASITSSISLPERDSDDESDAQSAAADIDGDVELDDVDDEMLEGELADGAEDDEAGDGADETASVDELSEEERQELEAELLAEKTADALGAWTETREVYNEEQERTEEERFFRVDQLDQLRDQLFDGDDEAFQEFRAQFPYVDWETGEIDVDETDPDHIPSWYEANGYEVMHPGHSQWEYVRMLPSDENSLGFVKIIFPNYDNIYLHDTPEKGLFDSQVRGFSHGCIRLEQPFELSELLLELGGTDEDVNIDRILQSEEYHPIFLERQIPVYLEYYTVRVDDEGRANFLADIYDYDDEELGESS